jgi:hypothetical protein
MLENASGDGFAMCSRGPEECSPPLNERGMIKLLVLGDIVTTTAAKMLERIIMAAAIAMNLLFSRKRIGKPLRRKLRMERVVSLGASAYRNP